MALDLETACRWKVTHNILVGFSSFDFSVRSSGSSDQAGFLVGRDLSCDDAFALPVVFRVQVA